MTILLYEEPTEPSSVNAREGARCHHCGGRFSVLVRVEPQTNGPPVTYYACERCAHVVVRMS